MQKILIRQVRSTTATNARMVRTLKALGLGRIGKTNVLNDTPAIRGMVRQVIQWLEVKHV